MRKHTLTALFVAIVAVTALAIWWTPSFMHRDTKATEPAPAVVSAPAEAPKPRRAPAPKVARKNMEKTTIAPDVVATLPATQPDVQARIKPLLNRGTRMELAAQGFRDAEQFSTLR